MKKSDWDLLILIQDGKGWKLGTGGILGDGGMVDDKYCINWTGAYETIIFLLDSIIIYNGEYYKRSVKRTFRKDFRQLRRNL